MKKIISTILVIVMLASMITIPTVTVSAETGTTITPDTSWYTGSGPYYINDAADLLGLVQLTHAKTSSGDYSVTKGKTFYLTADIDLNPGTVFNADGTYTGTTPVNIWKGIASFAGTFDGQGHTISGIYAPNGLSSGPIANEFGFIGRMVTGATLKNLNLTNGVFNGDSGDNIGSFVGVMHWGSMTNGTITVENCYSDLSVICNSSGGDRYAGGIYGGSWTDGAGTITIRVINTSFVGSVLNTANPSKAALIAGRAGVQSGSKYLNAEYTDCYYDITGKVYAETQGSPTITNNPAKMFIQKTEVSNGVFSVRFLSGLSSLNWDAVGFRVQVTLGDGTTVVKNYTTTSVYESIQAAGATILPQQLDSHYKYLYGLTIANIPADEGVTFVVTPFRTKGNQKLNAPNSFYDMYYNATSVKDAWSSFLPAYSNSPSQTYQIDTNSVMKEYSNVSKDNFTSFINTLKTNGFSATQENDLGKNSHVMMSNGVVNAYVSYIASQSILRVYTEPALRANPSDADATEGTITPKMWQLRVDNINSRENGGMSYVFLLADGTFFVIDGGYKTTVEADNLYNFLKEKNPNDGEPVISGWYFSHTHGDHIGAIQAFAPKYADKVDVKAFYYHFENSIPSGFANATAYWADATYYSRLHTGQKINLPGIAINVIYTLEDLYKTGFDLDRMNWNNRSAVIRVDVTAGDTTQKIMFLGDIQIVATNCINEYYKNNTDALKSDIVQFSHHGYEGADRTLYDAIAAPTVLWPINIVSTQNSYGSICNVFTKWGMETKSSSRSETDPVTGNTVKANYPNKAICGGYSILDAFQGKTNASYVKKIVLAGESASQEFAFPYTPSGSKLPNVNEIYNRDKSVLIPDESLFPF